MWACVCVCGDHTPNSHTLTVKMIYSFLHLLMRVGEKERESMCVCVSAFVLNFLIHIYRDVQKTMFDKSRNWTCIQYYHKFECACRAKLSSAHAFNIHAKCAQHTHRQTDKHTNRDVVKRYMYAHGSLTHAHISPDLRKLFSHVEWGRPRSAASRMCNVYSCAFGRACSRVAASGEDGAVVVVVVPFRTSI